jgi:hypothetical protein
MPPVTGQAPEIADTEIAPAPPQPSSASSSRTALTTSLATCFNHVLDRHRLFATYGI